MHLVNLKMRLIQRFSWIKHNYDKDSQVPAPLIYKFILTKRCNLRCKMCMLWGETGWCKNESQEIISQELDWGVFRRVIEQIRDYHPSFIFTGGEPLLYSHFAKLALLLKDNKWFATICTNGLLLDKFLEVINNNPYLIFLISLDGLEEENDLLRGEGVYKKVLGNIKLLKSLKKPPYIGIQFTIRPENIKAMYRFCQEMAALGVDWILLNPCWFISQEQARAYEDFLMKNFNNRPKSHLGYLFPYMLDRKEFINQFQKIKNEQWPIQISCYLKEPQDIHPYLDMPHIPPRNKFCYKQWLRMDFTPQGDVTPCAQFPDLSFGNIKDSAIEKIWNSYDYEKFRKLIREKYLPICSKCNAIYLYDADRIFL